MRTICFHRCLLVGERIMFTSISFKFLSCFEHLQSSSRPLACSDIPTEKQVQPLKMATSSFLAQFSEDELSHIYSLREVDQKSTLEFWMKAIYIFCLENGKLSFTMQDVTTAFTVDGLLPGFFDKSLVELLKQGYIINISELQNEPRSKDIISTLFSSLWSTVFEKEVDLSSKSFLSSSLWDEFIATVLSHARKLPVRDLGLSRLAIPGFPFTFFNFLETAISDIADGAKRQSWSSWLRKLSIADLDNIILKMSRSGLAIADEKLVRIAVSTGDSSSKATTDVSTAFIELRITVHDISRRLNDLHEKIRSYTQTAISAKARSDTPTALMYLKLRKNAESTQQRLLQAQYSLEECLQTMEGSEVNKIVVDAYSSASKALKTVRIESNVTAESVETALEMFEDEMDQMQEISSSLLSSSVATISEEERTDLENELDSLLKEDEVAKSVPSSSTLDTAYSLPTVPSSQIQPLPGSSRPVSSKPSLVPV